MPERIVFLGHATVAIELDGTRILTDPVLRGRVSGLMRRTPVPEAAFESQVDAVLISHLHRDHLDLPSLRLLPAGVPLLVPERAGRFLARQGFSNARELTVGETTTVGRLRVTATHANHSGFRPPFGPTFGCLGFVIAGSVRTYFAGDTDLFPEMAEFGPIDVALLPVAGWGPRLGPGHLDPPRAAEALRLIRPRAAVPIHWGSFVPLGMHLRQWSYLTRPAREFAELAGQAAPEVDVHILEPGEALDLSPFIGQPRQLA